MAIFESLNIREDERYPVILFILQSTFLGIFVGALDVGANTLFLQDFDEGMISKAFAISGIIGIVLTSIYSFFQSRIKFSRLAFLNLFTVFLITFALRAGYFFTDTEWLSFAMFVLIGPLNILAIVGFWGTVSRIFDLRQGKRLFGFIDGGLVIGVIISSIAVPVLIDNGFKTINLLFISSGSIFIAFFFQIFINSKYSAQLKIKVQKSAKKSRFMDTFKIPYVRTMALFVIFSMLVAFFVHYLFLAVADDRFASSEELAKFLGFLMAILTFVSILIKTFVYGPIMNNYGLKISLLISPVILAILTIASAFIGSTFGYTVESATFTFFFLLIALGKLFQKALKDSIEGPSLRMLYQSLDPSIRYEVQARVDGTINELAAFASGVILVILGALSFITLNHYTYFLGGIIFLWFIITIRLYNGYRKTLKATLEKAGIKEKHSIFEEILKGKSDNDLLLNKLLVIEQSKPWHLIDFIKENVLNAKGQTLDVFLEKINEIGGTEFYEILKHFDKKTLSTKNRDLLIETSKFIGNIARMSNDEKTIMDLLNSKKFKDRILAAKLIGASTNKDLKLNLTFLYRDLVPKVKEQAIWASKGVKQKELISFLIDFLAKDRYAPIAHAAMINSGETGLEMLNQAYYRSSITDEVRARILRLIPKTNGENATDFLFNKLSNNRYLNNLIIIGLVELEFKANEKQNAQLHQRFIEQAGVCAWNISVIYACPSEKKIPHLLVALNDEFEKSLDKLFDLLMLSYDKNSIETVKENLAAGTGESISFAIELLDTFITEDLKPYIFPLLEDVTLINKMRMLENYFPLRYFNEESLLTAIINRDNNLMSKQAKIFALNAYSYLEKFEVNDDLIAQMFSSDKVFRQVSASLIEKANKEQYLNCKKRLDDKFRVQLDRDMDNYKESGKSFIDRLNFMNSWLKEESTVNEGSVNLMYKSAILKVNDTNILGFEIFEERNYLIIIEEGTLELSNEDKPIAIYKENDLINIKEIKKKFTQAKIVARGSALLHIINADNLMEQLYDEEYLIKFVYENYTY